MFGAEVILVIISLVAILFNVVTLYIVGVRLQLQGVDLVLMGLVSLFDMGLSLNSLVRIGGVWSGWLVRYGSPHWWCGWDSTLVFTVVQTSLETVAALGLLRYLAICHGRVFRWPVWACVVGISFLSSMLSSIGFTTYEGSYAWSKSGLLCLPYTLPGMRNHRYFTVWFSFLFARFLVALICIVFCYSSVALSYRRLLATCPKHDSSSQLFPTSNTRLKRRRMVVTVQLVGVALGYIVCLLPDIVIALCFLLNRPGISKYVMAVSHSLLASSCILNPLFVLMAHDPSRRQLKICWGQLRSSRSDSRDLTPFPYQQY